MRIRAKFGAIQALMMAGVRKIILVSHLGRPAGQGFEADLSLAPVAEHLSTIKQSVAWVADWQN